MRLDTVLWAKDTLTLPMPVVLAEGASRPSAYNTSNY